MTGGAFGTRGEILAGYPCNTVPMVSWAIWDFGLSTVCKSNNRVTFPMRPTARIAAILSV